MTKAERIREVKKHLGLKVQQNKAKNASDEWLEAILSQDVIRLNKLHSILQLDT